MQGKTVVLTGGTSGIGEATALALAEKGADLALTCRSRERGEATQKRIEAAAGRDCVRLFEVDFESLNAVQTVAHELRDALPRIDVLVNNAGITMLRRELTVDGFEKTFAVNHLAPFLLTRELLPKILTTPEARIVNVASEAHRFAQLDLDDLQSEKKFSSMRTYGGSKLANILFTNELARRLEGRDVQVWSLHPGAVATRLGANNGGIAKILLPVLALFFKTPMQGAATSIKLASDPALDAPGGTYFADEKPKKTTQRARNKGEAEQLWMRSEALIRSALG